MDIERAHRVHKERLRTVLTLYGLGAHIYRECNDLYVNSGARVRVGNIMSDLCSC